MGVPFAVTRDFRAVRNLADDHLRYTLRDTIEVNLAEFAWRRIRADARASDQIALDINGATSLDAIAQLNMEDPLNAGINDHSLGQTLLVLR